MILLEEHFVMPVLVNSLFADSLVLFLFALSPDFMEIES